MFIKIPVKIEKVDSNHRFLATYLSDDIEYIYISLNKIITISPRENYCFILIDYNSCSKGYHCTLSEENLMIEIKNTLIGIK